MKYKFNGNKTMKFYFKKNLIIDYRNINVKFVTKYLYKIQEGTIEEYIKKILNNINIKVFTLRKKMSYYENDDIFKNYNNFLNIYFIMFFIIISIFFNIINYNNVYEKYQNYFIYTFLGLFLIFIISCFIIIYKILNFSFDATAFKQKITNEIYMIIENENYEIKKYNLKLEFQEKECCIVLISEDNAFLIN